MLRLLVWLSLVFDVFSQNLDRRDDFHCSNEAVCSCFKKFCALSSTQVLFFSFPAKNHSDTQVFFYLWIIFCFISSCYTLIWDLKMDWGLFDKNAGENTFLREGIVYPQKVRMHPALTLGTAL